uniref:Phostensin/Taperin PP1-binding domain-containing protein n=1 Tax=Macaca fascicularis TaxID=9541 RepID=A0A7N9IDY4_MACFA
TGRRPPKKPNYPAPCVLPDPGAWQSFSPGAATPSQWCPRGSQRPCRARTSVRLGSPATGGRGGEGWLPPGAHAEEAPPTVHEIEVIGGYLALQKSCLTKAGSSRKKVSSRTSGAVPPKEEELRAAVEVLRGHGLHSVLEEWFVEVLQNDLQANISPEFWNAISQCENSTDEPQCLLLLLDAFGLLESRWIPTHVA